VGIWRRNASTLWQPAPASPSAAEPNHNLRVSLALEQFLPVVTETEHASVLDLGCVWQATVSFFTHHGCKIFTEDLFQALYQARRETTPDALPLAERFLSGALKYPEASFRGILAWDLFDYLPEELAEPVAARLQKLLQPGGAFFGLFHNRPGEASFHRYRVLDVRTLELLPGSLLLPLLHTYPNRALLQLFAGYHSTRTFVGRDNLRELFLVK